jgi:GT2 family glycosyltransferase
LSAWPNVTFRHNRTAKGFGANHNAALRSARTDWLAIVNPDIRLTEFCFPVLHEAMACTSGTAMLAPKVIGPDGERQDSARLLPTPARVIRRAIRRLRGQATQADAIERATWFAGMFLVVRRDAFDAVGGFDERFFLYGEDVALSMQLVRQGFRIRTVDEAVVVHDARRATLRSFRHLRWHVASLLRLWSSPSFYGHERRFAALEKER